VRTPARPLTREEAALPLPESRRMSILELRAGTCRWPIGDPGQQGFCYCGADTGHPVAPYCPTHKARAFVPKPTLKPAALRQRRPA